VVFYNATEVDLEDGEQGCRQKEMRIPMSKWKCITGLENLLLGN
jgi:hypothetical protein